MKYKDYYKHLNEDLRSESDDYYYHITLAPYVESILNTGLQIGKNPTVSNYREHSKGKIFLCDIGVVDWWKHNIEAHAFDQFDDSRFHKVAVVKIKKDKLSDVYVDEVGSEDSRGNCYYVTKNIPANIIELHENETAKLNSIKEVNDQVLDQMVGVAQKEYDDWVQDEEGHNEELGRGGICHLIADELITVLYNNNIENCQTVCSTFEQHVYVVGKFAEGVYQIDIPYSIYETGGGYNWKKLPNVVFERGDIVISRLDSDPDSFEQYTDEI
jgi:hypothetical protein